MPTKKSRKGGPPNPPPPPPPSTPPRGKPVGGESLGSLASLLPAAIYRTDADGRRTWVNREWSEYTGQPSDAALGEGWLASIHPDDLSRVRRDWKAAAGRREPYVGEFRYVRPDGSICWILTRTTPELDREGNVTGYIGVSLDITELRQAHEAIKNGGAKTEPTLTAREREVAVLLAEGKSNKQVAEGLGISVRTAEAHRARIMRRLHLNSLAGLVKYALKRGWIEA